MSAIARVITRLLRPTNFIAEALRDALTWNILAFVVTMILFSDSAYLSAVFSLIIGIGVYAMLVLEEIDPAASDAVVPTHMRPLKRTTDRARIGSLLLFGVWSFNGLIASTGFQMDWHALAIITITIEVIMVARLTRSSRRAVQDPTKASVKL